MWIANIVKPLRRVAIFGLGSMGARYFSIFSNMDNFVLPVSTAVLHGAEENIHVPYLGHCALLYSTRVMDQVERCLLAPVKDS